jgi:hypothetical protein
MAEEQAERAAAEIGVRFLPSAPADFDPVQASADELRTYGYPPRPDPALHPDLFALWSRAVSPSMTTIEPRFGVVPLPVVPPGPVRPGPPPFPSRSTSANWAGSVNFPDINDGVLSVAASWVVPDITGPDMKRGDICSQWVGMDGWDPPGGDQVTQDVVQAGTTQMIDDSLRQQTFAWWDWAPDPSQPIGTSLPVGPGDQVYCVVRALSATEASFYLANLTRQVCHPPFQKSPSKPENRLRGGSADWVLEWTTGTPRLANFGSVEFDNCVATTAGGSVLWAGRGQILTMVDMYNYQLATAMALSDSQIQVDYVGGGPPI